MATDGTTPPDGDRPRGDAEFTRDTPGAAAGPQEAAFDNDAVRRVAQSAHATIDRLAETAEPVMGLLSDDADGSLQQRAEHLRDLCGEWTDSVRESMRANPLAAVGVALAVGVLLVRLSR